mgnify:FL=1
MKVFLSYAPKDAGAAEALVEGLSRRGVEAGSFDREVLPGDNWAKKMGEALKAADLIVFLLIPRAMETASIRHDIEFALASRKHRGRVYRLFIGSGDAAGKDVPWILLTLPHRRIGTRGELSESIPDIVGMLKPSRKIAVHA